MRDKKKNTKKNAMTNHPYIKIDRRKSPFKERKKQIAQDIKKLGIKETFKKWNDYFDRASQGGPDFLKRDTKNDAEWYWLNKETINYLIEKNTEQHINDRN